MTLTKRDQLWLLIASGLSKTTAHEILGQSVDYRQPLKLGLALFASIKTGVAA